MILTVSYANERVARKSYARLVESMKDDPCEVRLFDNHYPLNRADFIKDLCQEYGFQYNKSFAHSNIGLYPAINSLIGALPKDCKKIIGFDGDNYPMTDNWHKALLDVLDDPTVGTVTLSSEIIAREIAERGFTPAVINGHKCKISHQVLTCTVSGWNVPFLKSTNGITSPHVYYGGNEVDMWRHYKEKGMKYVVLDDHWEELKEMKAMQDWQYEEYKLLYAHRGLGMSFEEYLKTNPVQHGYDILIKQIFG